MITPEILEKISTQLKGNGKITFLVGAGLSAESGIPTFRDADGYWTLGSSNYTPQEMGTLRMFNMNSHQVWNWYLNRLQVCKNAQPNSGHLAITEIQNLYPERFALISQNVDGLHFKSGLNEKQLFLIHGDLRFMRCSGACTDELFPLPGQLANRGLQDNLSFEETLLINCPNCDDICRPHVLWFDEQYNEKYYHVDTALQIAKETTLLIVIGTSGATTMPKKIVELVSSKPSLIVDVNPKPNLLTNKIIQPGKGYWVEGKSALVLTELAKKLKDMHIEKNQEESDQNAI